VEGTAPGSVGRREISRRVTALFKDFVGRGPTSVRTYIQGDLVLSVLADTLTRAETVLAEQGQGELVRASRRALVGTLHSELEHLIADEIGREVVGVLGDYAVVPDYAMLACLLAPLADSPDGTVTPAPGTDAHGLPDAQRKISRGMSALYKELIGRGATEARTYLEEDVVSVLLGNTLTRAEHTLANADSPQQVREMRREFQGALKERAVSVVEEALGRPVRVFLSDHSIAPDYALEVFVLEDHEPDGPDSR
jgi:uncharacterized protein YbcI